MERSSSLVGKMPRPRKIRTPSSSPPSGGNSPVLNSLSRNDYIFSNWSTEECSRLIQYVTKNGFDGDVKKLMDRFPGHTETNTRHFVTELGRPAITENEQDPIPAIATKFEKFQEMARVNNLSQSYGSVLSTFVKWRALFENHPDPSSCGGVDYAEIYRAIGALMLGEIPRAINSATAKKLNEIFERFLIKLKRESADEQDAQSYKRPVGSVVKDDSLRNTTLTKRRRVEWEVPEKNKGKLLLTEDLERVREVYLTTAWANPFRFPDERSRFREVKVTVRKNLLGQPSVETDRRSRNLAEVRPARAPRKKKRRKN